MLGGGGGGGGGLVGGVRVFDVEEYFYGTTHIKSNRISQETARLFFSK